MAVENQFKHDKDLFKKADGSTMVFFMRPCSHRQELRPLIESGGGKVTSKVMKGSIKLAEKGSTVSSDDYISAKYIEDCVNQNKLLPMDSYRVKSGSRVRNESGDSNESKESFVSNDSLSPASYIVQTRARDYKGRSKYSKEDDVAMITFLIEEKRYSEALGIKVWKDMESKKITSHTASSMNTRYRKHILPNIRKYRYDVDRRWLAKLTVGVVVKETEPEFSAEALFTISKKSSKSETTVRKVDLTGDIGDEFDFKSGEESSQDEEEKVHASSRCSKKEINEDKEHNFRERYMDKNDKRTDKIEGRYGNGEKSNEIEKNKDRTIEVGDKLASTENSQDLAVDDDLEDKNISESQKCDVLEKDNERHSNKEIFYAQAIDLNLNRVKHGEIFSDNCVHNKRMVNEKEELVEDKKDKVDGGPEMSEEVNETGKKQKSKASKGNNKGDNAAKLKNGRDELKFLATDSLSPSDIFEMTDDENIQDEKDVTVEDGENKKLKSVVNMDDGRMTVSQDSGDSIYYSVEDELDVKTVLRSGKKIGKETNMGIPHLTLSHTDTGNDKFDSEAEIGEQKRKGRGNKQVEDLKAGTKEKKGDTGNKCKNINNNTHVVKENSQDSENAETQPPEVEICSNEVTSSGQVMEMVDNSEHGDALVDSDQESDSFDEMLRNCMNKKKKISVINMESEDLSNEVNKDVDVVVTNNPTGKSNNKQAGKRKQEIDIGFSSTREKKKRKLVEECQATIKSISDKYGLSKGFVRQLLYQCSSDVNRLISYIEYGPCSLELPPWTELDDEILEKDRKAVCLLRKFGEKDVINRYNFMNYIT